MKLSFLKGLDLRKKAVLLIVLILILAGLGLLGILLKTGKIKIKADTIYQTVTVSGKFTDTISGLPVQGASITVAWANLNGTPVTVKTDTNGKYSATVKIINSYPDHMVWVNAVADGYPTGIPSSTKEFDVAGASLIESRIVDFSLSKIPQDIISTKPLDSVSARCRTQASDDAYSWSYHPGDYVGKVVNGILFCAAEQNAQVFTNYASDITRNAALVNSLVVKTGLSFTPVIYLTGNITWKDDPAAYTAPDRKEIIISVDQMKGLSVITHEVGHLVDWYKGTDMPANSGFRTNKSGTKSHMYYSDNFDFNYAAFIARRQIISGYATKSRQEMFAEIFTAQQTPLPNKISDFGIRAYLQYALTNSSFSNFEIQFSSSKIYPTKSADQINAAMYIYKAVAKAGNIDEFFPGTLKNSWSFNDIWYGKYMNVGVVPINVARCAGLPAGGKSITIGGDTGVTRNKKDTGVFPDGKGDLFDTTGTAVLMNVAPGNLQPITSKGLSPNNIKPSAVKVVAGANPVLKINLTEPSSFTFDRQFGSTGTSEGKFNGYTNIASGKFLYVADEPNRRVQVFNYNGTFLYSFGQNIFSAGGDSPMSLAVDEDRNRIYVATGLKVRVFNVTGAYIATIMDAGLQYPLDIKTGGPNRGAI